MLGGLDGGGGAFSVWIGFAIFILLCLMRDGLALPKSLCGICDDVYRSYYLYI